MDTLEIREARTDHDQRELILLADFATHTDGHCIGWLPRQAWHNACDSGRMYSLFRNDDRVGWVMWSRNQQRELRILQIWVRSDARLIEHGKALVTHLEEAHARRLHAWQLRAWVADDLAANLFWPQIGFVYKGWRYGPAKHARKHRLWTKAMSQLPPTNSAEPANKRSVELYA